MGEGLMSNLYFLGKSFHPSNPRCAFLTSQNLEKVRSKLEKSFPELPFDSAKITGWDIFTSQAGAILEEFGLYDDIMTGVVDFKKSSEQVLKDMLKDFSEVNLERNANLIHLYLDLLCTYMRVLYTFNSVPVKKLAYVVVNAALLVQTGQRLSTSNDAITLFQRCESLPRHFIDTFATISLQIQPMILQLYETLLFYEDCETLRHRGVLNCVEEGENMSFPCQLKLSPTSALSAHSALTNATKYRDYIVFAHLACPALFLLPLGGTAAGTSGKHSAVIGATVEIFRTAASTALYVEIYRDLTLSIHEEFEKIFQLFPNKQHDPTVHFNSSTIKQINALLKEVARTAVKSGASRQVYRRSFLRTELRSMRLLMTVSPGLLGPKFPQVVALAAMSQAEILDYFRHYPDLSSNKDAMGLRKDCRKHYHPSEFASHDTTLLLYELGLMKKLVRRYRDIVRRYYAEYLAVNDLSALQKIVNEAQAPAAFAVIAPFVEAFPTYLRSIDMNAIFAATEGSIFEGTSENAQTSATFPNLLAYRLDWDRCTALWTSFSTVAIVRNYGASFTSLFARLQASTDRSRYVDSLDHILKAHFEVHGCWWFRGKFWKEYSFAATHHAVSADIEAYSLHYPHHALAYFDILEDIVDCVHPDNPEELALLGDIALRTTNSMIANLGEHVLNQVKLLLDHMGGLEKQIAPAEAANRQERYLQLKARMEKLNASSGGSMGSAGAIPNEPYPGCESEGWAKQSIAKIINIRSNLTQILSAAQEKGIFTVYGKKYNLAVYLTNKIAGYFAARLKKMFFNENPVGRTIERPSTLLARLTTSCSVVQLALSTMNTLSESPPPPSPFSTGSNGDLGLKNRAHADDFPLTLRSILFSQFVDPSNVPPPGVPLNASTVSIPPANLSATSSMIAGEDTAANGGDGHRPSPPPASLIQQLSEWFVQLADTIGIPTSGLVWIPSQQFFLSIPYTGKTGPAAGSAAAGPAQYAGASLYPFVPDRIHTFLNTKDLACLVKIIGPHGVKAIESGLIKRIHEKTTQLLQFLADNRGVLLEFDRLFCVNINPILRVKGLADFDRLLIDVGVCLALRQMLHGALRQVVDTQFPQLSPTLQTIASNYRPWGDNLQTLLPLYSVYHDVSGVVGNYDVGCKSSPDGGNSIDLTLLAALSDLVESPQFADVLPLFPSACAALFALDKWDHTTFNGDWDVFGKNEHLGVLAAAKLMSGLFVQKSSSVDAATSAAAAAAANGGEDDDISLSSGSVGGAANRNGATRSLNVTDTGAPGELIEFGYPKPAVLINSRTMALKYLKLSSQVLLTARSVEGSVHAQRPLRPMGLLLEDFVNYLPSSSSDKFVGSRDGTEESPNFVGVSSFGLDRGSLERFFPYAILHNSAMDVRMGKVRENDPLSTFSAGVANGRRPSKSRMHVGFANDNTNTLTSEQADGAGDSVGLSRGDLE